MKRTYRAAVLLALSGLVLCALPGCPRPHSAYSVSTVPVNGAVEHRFSFREAGTTRHFMTLIEQGGAVAIRPHPGVDPNGWGTTWYPQPFLAGAVLGHSDVTGTSITSGGIEVSLSGSVSRGTSETYGTWSAELAFTYDRAAKTVFGSGTYNVDLEGPLATPALDLNVGKLASNYLDDVPLLSGGTGDTGDMAQAVVGIDAFNFTWVPPDQTAHYPTDTGETLSILVEGDYNEVDSAAQGHNPIAAAYKPSLLLVLSSQSTARLAFGGQYDTDTAQDFWEDNVGITPLLLQSSPEAQLDLEITLESQALPGDGT